MTTYGCTLEHLYAPFSNPDAFELAKRVFSEELFNYIVALCFLTYLLRFYPYVSISFDLNGFFKDISLTEQLKVENLCLNSGLKAVSQT